ncbi:hypothetical protein Ancab_032019, partial [Ancistrocladus abbreviatus]
EEGWPLGLQSLNVRIGLLRNREFSVGSVSFNSTLLTTSPSSSSSLSTDLDTQLPRCFKHPGNISSSPPRTSESTNCKVKKKRTKTWFYFLCSKPASDDDLVRTNNNQSLCSFLEEERRAANIQRRRMQPMQGAADALIRG